MISIRKFVGHAGAAAGISGALLIAMSMQTGAQSQPSQAAPPTQTTLSAGCTAAIQNLKAAFIADITEDRAEYAASKLNGAPLENDTDSTEAANFMALWNAIRTACAPSATPSSTATAPVKEIHSFIPSTMCVAAVQTAKAAWAQHPTTAAQWQQLRTLVQAARNTCGWPTWSFSR